MIIDCHGHYTTEPKDLHRFRKDQTEAVKNKSALPPRAGLKMSDDEIRESLEQNQIRLQKERGTDVTIFSPRASGMGHHVGDESVSIEWTQICNDLIHRCVTLYPKNFIGVCQLPQSLNVPPKNSAKELERCVNELGFVGCNLNPDPSGGYFNSPPLKRTGPKFAGASCGRRSRTRTEPATSSTRTCERCRRAMWCSHSATPRSRRSVL
jgi:4-oxalmesaconate hydratase